MTDLAEATYLDLRMKRNVVRVLHGLDVCHGLGLESILSMNAY